MGAARRAGKGEEQAKDLPEARTARAKRMEEVRGSVVYAVENRGAGTSDLLGYVLDKLVEVVAELEAAETPDNANALTAALAKVWCTPSLAPNREAFVVKWSERIREAWREYEGEAARDLRRVETQIGPVREPPRHATKPAEDPKLVRALLADALDIVGIHRPASFDWIKGLPVGHGEQRSVLADFRVERACWDATAETSKVALHHEYEMWLAAAKEAHPERYDTAEPLTLNAFTREMNLSLAVSDVRPAEKGEKRDPRCWKGVRILPPSAEPAGDKAIRTEAEFAEALRKAFVVPPK